jgi:uncharacterized protein (DUF58 family)
MFSALKNNDKVGLLTFCDEVADYIPPRKGKANVLRLVRRLVSVDPVPRETNLAAALEFLSRVVKRRAVAFLISDFLAPEARQAMAVCNKRHDLVAITVADELKKVGVDELPIRTDEDYLTSLRRFFRMREKRFR